MSSLTLAPTPFEQPDGEATLAEWLVASWQRLLEHGPVECPVCAGEMRPEYAAHALPLGGRCGRCGSMLC